LIQQNINNSHKKEAQEKLQQSESHSKEPEPKMPPLMKNNEKEKDDAVEKQGNNLTNIQNRKTERYKTFMTKGKDSFKDNSSKRRHTHHRHHTFIPSKPYPAEKDESQFLSKKRKSDNWGDDQDLIVLSDDEEEDQWADWKPFISNEEKAKINNTIPTNNNNNNVNNNNINHDQCSEFKIPRAHKDCTIDFESSKIFKSRDKSFDDTVCIDINKIQD